MLSPRQLSLIVGKESYRASISEFPTTEADLFSERYDPGEQSEEDVGEDRPLVSLVNHYHTVPL